MFQSEGLKSSSRNCRLGFDDRTQRCRLRRTNEVQINVHPYSSGLAFNLTGYDVNSTILIMDIFSEVTAIYLNGILQSNYVSGSKRHEIQTGFSHANNVLSFQYNPVYTGDVESRVKAYAYSVPIPP